MVNISVVIRVIMAMIIIAPKAAKAESFHTKVINALYGTNHTERPDECGRDWTYFHYIASEVAAVIALELLHGIFIVTACIKLWKRNNPTLNI